MSFFDDNKTLGTALIVIGAIQFILGIVALVGAVSGGIDGPTAVAAIGPIIVAILYFAFGWKIRNSQITNKLDILAQYVKLAGLGVIINAVFSIWNTYDDAGGKIGTTLVSLAIAVIIGLIIIGISTRINDGKKDNLDRVIWIILLILFALGAIFNFIGLIGQIIAVFGSFSLTYLANLVITIANLIICIFMVCLLFNKDVKEGMNM
ncbi:MAG: hypothetical protein IKP20_00580 [Candidatus Methanomethylophilaceae archaeon]|jgi:hypothetical protein|nr:hypothetical protein [Candidatus Methanomethylophilaceae archaeon]